MGIVAIVEGQVVAGATATGVLYVTSGGVVATDGPTWASNTLTVAGLLDVTAPAATDIPLSITGAAAQSANYVTIQDGAAADVFTVSSGQTFTFVSSSTKKNSMDTSGLHVDMGSGANQKGGAITFGVNQNQVFGSAATGAGSDGFYWTDRQADSATSNGGSYNALSLATAGAKIFRWRDASGEVAYIGVGGDFVALGDFTKQASDQTGNITRTSSEEVHTLAAAATSDTTTISIPSGARLLGVSMNVDTAVVDDGGDDTWSAAFVTGSTTTLATGAAAAQNTKVDLMLPDEITTGVCQVRFTANGGSFSAGVIEVVAYYETLTSLANA